MYFTAARTRGALVVCAVIAIAMFACAVSPRQGTRPDKQDIERLLTQRCDTLQRVAEIVQLQFESGTVGHEAVHRATVALLEAELERGGLARQVQLHEQLVDSFRTEETRLEAAFAVGGVHETDVLIATAERLQAEAKLMKAQMGTTR